MLPRLNTGVALPSTRREGSRHPRILTARRFLRAGFHLRRPIFTGRPGGAAHVHRLDGMRQLVLLTELVIGLGVQLLYNLIHVVGVIHVYFQYLVCEPLQTCIFPPLELEHSPQHTPFLLDLMGGCGSKARVLHHVLGTDCSASDSLGAKLQDCARAHGYGHVHVRVYCTDVRMYTGLGALSVRVFVCLQSRSPAAADSNFF